MPHGFSMKHHGQLKTFSRGAEGNREMVSGSKTVHRKWLVEMLTPYEGTKQLMNRGGGWGPLQYWSHPPQPRIGHPYEQTGVEYYGLNTTLSGRNFLPSLSDNFTMPHGYGSNMS